METLHARSDMRVRLRAITLQRLDGPRATARVRTFAEADEILRLWATTAPELGKGYHRVAYGLLFEDGQEYSDLYRLNRTEVIPIDLARSARERLEVNAGRRSTRLAAYDLPYRRSLLSAERQPPSVRKRAAQLLDLYALDG